MEAYHMLYLSGSEVKEEKKKRPCLSNVKGWHKPSNHFKSRLGLFKVLIKHHISSIKAIRLNERHVWNRRLLKLNYKISESCVSVDVAHFLHASHQLSMIKRPSFSSLCKTIN